MVNVNQARTEGYSPPSERSTGDRGLHYGVVGAQSSPPGRLQRTPRGCKRRSDACRTGAQRSEGADAQRQRAGAKRRSAERHPLEDVGVRRGGRQPREGRGVLLGRYKLHVNKLPDAHADRVSVGERKPSEPDRSSDAGGLCAGTWRPGRQETHAEDRERKEHTETPHNVFKPAVACGVANPARRARRSAGTPGSRSSALASALRWWRKGKRG
jgi:hypothetical protein